jgi:stress-induced-phosphoprotein 1
MVTVKAYIRKGLIYYNMKDYQKALETYDQGLKYDENNKELEANIAQTINAINERSRKQSQTGEVDKETLQAAMRNPEIQAILSDPVMQQILSDMQQNPAAVKEYLQSHLLLSQFFSLTTLFFFFSFPATSETLSFSKKSKNLLLPVSFK